MKVSHVTLGYVFRCRTVEFGRIEWILVDFGKQQLVDFIDFGRFFWISVNFGRCR